MTVTKVSGIISVETALVLVSSRCQWVEMIYA